MAELIDKGVVVARIRTVAAFEYNDTRRNAFKDFLDMILAQPTATEAEIRAKAIDEFAKRLHALCGMQIGEYSYPDLLYRNCIDEVADELKEEQ